MYICAVDIGTTTVKAMIVNETGQIMADSSVQYPLITAQGGVVEQDARLWYELTARTVRECVPAIPPEKVVCLCLSAQGGSLVPVDSWGEPLANASTWMDVRGSGFIKELEAGLDAGWYNRITGRRLRQGSCIAKIRSSVHLHPAGYLTTLEYVNLRLTGRAVTDPTSAAMTGMLDIHTRDWQPEIVALSGAGRDTLPEVMPTGAVIGPLTPRAAAALGLTASTVVVNGGHDQFCAAAGANVTKPGDVLLSTGSAWVVFGTAQSLGTTAGLTAGPHVTPGLYGLFSSFPTGGIALEWVRSKLMAGAEAGYDELNLEVMARMGKNKGLIMRPTFGSATACIGGMSLHTDAYDIALAAMEGVVFETRRIIEHFAAVGYAVESIKLIGGAVKGRPWQELVRAVIGPVRLYENANVACAGAAALGGTALGVWPDLGTASSLLCSGRMYDSASDFSDFYHEKYETYKGGA